MASCCCIDIDDQHYHYRSRARRCNSMPGPTSCIYIVDKRIRDQKPDAYTPDTVSISPYHRHNKNPQMLAMEALKFRYMKALVLRTRISKEEYREAIKAIKPDPCEYYFDLINIPDEREFLEVMLVDGLFIIELFCKYRKESGVELDADDPIFYSNLKRMRVVCDLMLLENQIPMSVLQALFNLSKNPESDKLSLIELALDFFDDLIPDARGKYNSLKEKGLTVIQHQLPNIEHKHLLDLLSFTLEAQLPPHKKRSSSLMPVSLPCVKELRHSGVQFRRSRNKNGSLMDLDFHKKGVFEITPICVNDFTDPFFRNLIAYEQHRYEGTYYMTSYALLMGFLISSPADVASLRRNDIIWDGDDKMVASLFNNLSREIFTDDFFYGELCLDVRHYYYSCWNGLRAKTLRQDFCSPPWKFISVVAAVILLLLTLWGTLFATFPVFNVTFKH